MGKAWDNYAKLRKPRENHGITVENHRRTIGKPSENYGKGMGKLWKTIGKPWEKHKKMMISELIYNNSNCIVFFVITNSNCR